MIPSASPSKSLAVSVRLAVVTAANAAVAFVRAAWKARRHRRVVGELLAFDDHALRDIGLTRGDVAAALADAPFRDPSVRLRIFAVERRASRRGLARERLLAEREPPVDPNGQTAPITA